MIKKSMTLALILGGCSAPHLGSERISEDTRGEIFSGYTLVTYDLGGIGQAVIVPSHDMPAEKSRLRRGSMEPYNRSLTSVSYFNGYYVESATLRKRSSFKNLKTN